MFIKIISPAIIIIVSGLIARHLSLNMDIKSPPFHWGIGIFSGILIWVIWSL